MDNKRRNQDLFSSVKNGDLAKCADLIKAGADPKAMDSVSWTPLHYGAYHGFKDVCQLLIDHGAEIDAVDVTKGTPLSSAATMGHSDVCELLISHHADPDWQDDFGRTPLYWAASRGRRETCRLLVGMGVATDVTEAHQGFTPIQIAAYNGQTNVVQYFIEECGEKIDQTTSTTKQTLDQLTLDELAQANNHRETLNYLTSYRNSIKTEQAVRDALGTKTDDIIPTRSHGFSPL